MAKNIDTESQFAKDARVRKLFDTLDTQKAGYLDLKGLRDGLRRIDHRELPMLLCLIEVLKDAVLTNGSFFSSSAKHRKAPRTAVKNMRYKRRWIDTV